MSDDPIALMGQAAQLAREQRAEEAMQAYRTVVTRWPHIADAWYNLAVLQRHSFQLPDALASYQKALDAGIARPEEVHLNRSVIYTNYLHDHVAAARELELALAINPAYAPALMNLATLHEDLGRRDDASQLYARILEHDPEAHEALARFANLQPLNGIDASLIERLRASLARAGHAADRASLGFALGRLLDGTREYASAFDAYRAANGASLESAGPHVVPYEAARQAGFVDLMIRHGHPAVSARPSSTTPRPIFVCGMFRSGSTLVEQLLAAVPGVAAGGEIDFIPHFINRELVPFQESLRALTADKLGAAAERYRGDLQRAFPGAAFVTDKRPDNFLYLGLIKSLFPEAKIVHTTRNPLDNALSIYFLHLDQQMSYALDLQHIAHYYREYRRLMTHWKSLFGADIVDVDYDALVADPNPVFERLCASLGLPWTGEVPNVTVRSTAIKTASSWQVREPLYKTSSGRARHYGPQVEALRVALADLT